MTLSKRQNDSDGEQISECQGLRVRGSCEYKQATPGRLRGGWKSSMS